VNLVLLDPDEISADSFVELRGRRALHLREVVGVEVGDRVRVGVVRGASGSATVRSMQRDAICLETRLEGGVAEPPTVELILALPRPKVLSRVLETVSSIGVRRIDLVNAWRVDKSYFRSRRVAPDALAAALRLGCEQGGTTWVPDVAVHQLLMPFLGDLGARLDAEACASRRLLAHPRADALLEEALPPGDGAPVVLAIGPEGGWIDREVASFAGLDFRAVSLGATVLRVESAVSALLAEVGLLRRLRGLG